MEESKFSQIGIIHSSFKETRGTSLEIIPFMDDRPHGIFANRAPGRPNPIGISTERLIKVNGPLHKVRDLDILDGIPLLDTKPYVPEFDSRKDIRIGWLKGKIS